jgi:flagellar biosynthesis/type III secretory pathway protein FliH
MLLLVLKIPFFCLIKILYGDVGFNGNEVNKMENWYDDDADGDEFSQDLKAKTRHFYSLGENDGLQEGMLLGEKKGYKDGFIQESHRSFEMGRLLGASKLYLKYLPSNNVKNLNDLVSQVEINASSIYFSDPITMQLSLSQLEKELVNLGWEK